ncbi:MAG: prepilin-type N-terminal cleavage/methylation domain-containing protein [Planctomycetes bacterium]|nr:prepilin-type N-terminal cleavage/methylation domain-containing protein [Planctomycetota bacterium]
MIYQGKAKPPRLRGFTLIELVVVIAIILLLLGLTLSAGLAIRKQSEVRETENILRLLDTAMQEWQRIAERPLSWGEDDNPIIGIKYDLQGKIGALPLTPEMLVITELLEVINRPDQVKNIIAQIDSDFIHRYVFRQYPAWIKPMDEDDMDGFAGGITVLDAWGWPIYATHPGRVANPDAFPVDNMPVIYPIDEDGTVSTYNEGIYGTAMNRTVVFVSAGPDGEFGLQSATGIEFENTRDNIFSTAIDRE